MLARTQFSLDVDVRDSEDPDNYAMSVMVATALADAAPDYPADIAIVYTGAAPPELWLDSLMRSFTSIYCRPTVEFLDSANAVGKVCIFLGEVEQPMLVQLDSFRFDAIKRILNNARGLLWVTRDASIDCPSPEKSLHTDILRTLRLEDAGKRFVSLDLDRQSDPWTIVSANFILDIFRRTFDGSLETNGFEYAERDSIQIPRVYEDNAENESVAPFTDNLAPAMQPFLQPGRELRLEVEIPGMLDTLVFREDPSAGQTLAADFVEIEPRAFGLNFRDIMVAMGQLREKIMGFECGGVITRIGPSPTHDFKPGDRVRALTTKGHWASRIRIHWTCVAKIPEHMTFDAAASIPTMFVTTWFSLVETARLQKAENVLIHAGSSGVGQAAIIIAKHIGSEIFVTVDSREKKEFIMKTYGIDPSHILSSRDPSFETDIMSATKGRGVDVVLNSLSGLLLQASWRCVATLGRFIEIGKKDIQANKNLDMEVFGRGISFSAVDLIHLGNYNGPMMSKTLRQILRLLEKQTLVPIQPVTVYPISELQRAFRLMQGGKHLGKILIKPNPDDLVKVNRYETFPQIY